MKIGAPDQAGLTQIAQFLLANGIEIHSLNAKRLSMSTGPISNDIADALLSMNATVSIERRWTTEDLMRGNGGQGLD